MMRHRLEILALSLALLPTWSLRAESQDAETRRFPVESGDTLIVQSDHGKIYIHAWDQSTVQATIRKRGPGQRLDNVQVVSDKSGGKIFFHSYFYNYSGESVDLEFQVPPLLNILVWGANPDVEIAGVAGLVRIQTLTGRVRAENLASSATVMTESGAIHFDASTQPIRDIKLETASGDIHCNTSPALSFRAWIRTAGSIHWDNVPAAGFLEKQVGSGGPLLQAASLTGNVYWYQRTVLTNSGGVPAMQVPTVASNPASGSGHTGGERRPEVTEPVIPAEQRTRTRTDPPVLNDPTTAGIPERPSNPKDPGPMPQGEFAIKVAVDSVYLNVSVRDRHTNRSVPNLRIQDFKVYEDNVEQTLLKFEPTEAPIHLMLLLDISGSTKGFIDLIREASIEFTQQIKPNDRIAVAVFNSDVQLIHEFTNDREDVARSIRRIRSGGGTAFYDALYRSISSYMRGVDGRKAIVVFTDGVDNQLTGDRSNGSTITFGELFREIQEIDSTIYTIFLDTEGRQGPTITTNRGNRTVIGVLGDILGGRIPTPTNPPGRRRSNQDAYQEAFQQLRMIADQTGGRMYSPDRVEDLYHVYSEIADDLRMQYTLAYNSSNPTADGGWRSIAVRLDRSDLVARTRKGYYARGARP